MPAGGFAAVLLLSLALIFRDVDAPATDVFDLPYSVRAHLVSNCTLNYAAPRPLPIALVVACPSARCCAPLHAALATRDSIASLQL